MKDLSENATWPEANRGKIEEYLNAFDTVNRYGSEDEENKPGEEEVNKAMQVIAGSEQFLSSDAGNGRTVSSIHDCGEEALGTRSLRI